MKGTAGNRAFRVCYVLMTCAATAHPAEPPPVAHNPFARPPSKVIVDQRSPIRDERMMPERMDLRATLVAERQSLANVAGKILHPGDEAQGYTLVRVYEDRAIFEYQGRQVTIFVKPEARENDD